MRAFLVAGMAFAAVGLIAAADRDSGLPMWWHLRTELGASQHRIEALAAENAALEQQIGELRSDPFALERAIREDLELAKPREIVVRFGSDSQ